MIRIAAFIIGLLLVVVPGLWLMEVSVPVPKFRKGGFVDFLFLAQTLFAVYGSVLLGVALSWMRASRTGQSLRPNEAFMAGMFGVVAACIAFFGGGSLYGIAKYGAFAKAIGGNLWGMLAIFWGILGALVSAGIALLFHACRSPSGPTGAGPRTGPWSSSPPRISP
jgi:hypothetical protein